MSAAQLCIEREKNIAKKNNKPSRKVYLLERFIIIEILTYLSDKSN